MSSFAIFLGQVGAGQWAWASDSRMERKYPWDHSHVWCKKVRAGELGACCQPRPAWWQPGPTGRPSAHLRGRPGTDRRIGFKPKRDLLQEHCGSHRISRRAGGPGRRVLQPEMTPEITPQNGLVGPTCGWLPHSPPGRESRLSCYPMPRVAR